MKRREMVRLSVTLPAAMAWGCRVNRSVPALELSRIQDSLFEDFSVGKLDTFQSALADGFSFVDGGAFGDARRFEKRNELLFKYHREKGNLPLSMTDRIVKGVGDFAWIECRVRSGPEGRAYGSLTQIYTLGRSRWQLVRQHFSRLALS
jgi:hypothetical protein